MRALTATLAVATVVLGAAEAAESLENPIIDTVYVRTDLGLVHGTNVGRIDEFLAGSWNRNPSLRGYSMAQASSTLRWMRSGS
jgi:hypothetical protein